MAEAKILEVRVGRIAPLAGTRAMSGYVKHPVSGAVEAGPAGLAGDEQADRKVHGGPDKALYLYPSEHYPRWIDEHPEQTDRLVLGAFGENLPTVGLDEQTVRVGDVYRLGRAIIQVTEPRQPCFKMSAHLGTGRLLSAMIRNGRCGWYARVVEPGLIAADDALLLLDRPNPGWTIARLAEVLAARAMTRDILAELVAMPGLSEGRRMKALALLAKGA